MSADSTPEALLFAGVTSPQKRATTPIYERVSHGHWPTGLRPASDRKLGVRASRIDGRLPAYSVEKLVFVAATILPPNTHPIDNWYYAGTQAKQQPPGPDIIESCYPLGSSQSRAASRDENFRPTPRWEFFNRIGQVRPVSTLKWLPRSGRSNTLVRRWTTRIAL